MRVESQFIQQTLVESAKTVEKKDIKDRQTGQDNPEEMQPSLSASIFGSRVYSPASLRAAVDLHAKFLTVAENNLTAANHPATIPRAILDRFNSRQL